MTSSTSSTAVVGLEDSVNVLRRNWKPVALLAVVGLVLGVLGLLARAETYSSDALVEVRPLISQGDSPNLDVTRQVNTTTEQAIASSQRVVERALALLEAAVELDTPDLNDPAVEARARTLEIDGERARAVQEQIAVTVEDSSEVLRIEATAARAVRAQELAQSVAHAYLDFRAEAATVATSVARQRLLDREAELLAELDELARQIESIERDLAEAGEPVRPAELRGLELAEVSKRQNLEGIGTRLANIDAITINVGEVLDDADLPTSPAGVPAPVGPAAGLLVGLGLGVAAAFARDRSDATVRDPLTELPAIGNDILGFSPGNDHIAVTEGSDVAVDEAFRRTQAGLLHKMDRQDQQIVLVAGTASAASSQAAALAAANLAVAAARVGRMTLLILSDLRNPGVHGRFRLDNTSGLSEVINGQASLSEVSHRVPELTTLFVVPPGADLSAPTRLLQSSNMGRLLDKARAGYDLVVVHAPSLTDYADAVVIGPLCDTAVLIVEPALTRRADLDSAIRQVEAVGLDVAGSIIAEPIGRSAKR